MELNEYQRRAMETRMPSCDNESYMILNLSAEVGELCGKVAKPIRKGDMRIDGNEIVYTYKCSREKADEYDEAMLDELGDVLWMVSGLADSRGWELEYIAERNLNKLASRKERGVIDGNGDNR